MKEFSTEQLALKIKEVDDWYHTIELAPGLFTPGVRNCRELLEQLDLPGDLTGMRALDIGANDGFFSIELEQRGAEVVALDHVPAELTGFKLLRELYDSKVVRHTENIYNLSREKYGQFDIVLCLGVLYHLRDPLLALSRIREVCVGELYAESFVMDSRLVNEDGTFTPLAELSERLLTIPIAQFYPRNDLVGDYTSWWGFNSVCLRKMIESTNFTVLFETVVEDRAILKCAINDDADTKYWRSIESGTISEYR